MDIVNGPGAIGGAPLQTDPDFRPVGGEAGSGFGQGPAGKVATVIEGVIAHAGPDFQGPVGEGGAIGGPGKGGGGTG